MSKAIADEFKNEIKAISRSIKNNKDVSAEVCEIVCSALDELELLRSRFHGVVEDKSYHVFVNASGVSRPFLADKFIESADDFRVLWDSLCNSANSDELRFEIAPESVETIIYTATMSIAILFDMYYRRNRKSPGTFFEIVVRELLRQLLPRRTQGSSVNVENESYNISTDILFESPNEESEKHLVIAAKITTRERIVQPYVHQRILESMFPGQYASVLVCVSEMKGSDKPDEMQTICVPNAIKIYEQHLASLSGIYYCDIPNRYVQDDVLDVVDVASIARLFTQDLPNLVLK